MHKGSNISTSLSPVNICYFLSFLPPAPRPPCNSRPNRCEVVNLFVMYKICSSFPSCFPSSLKRSFCLPKVIQSPKFTRNIFIISFGTFRALIHLEFIFCLIWNRKCYLLPDWKSIMPVGHSWKLRPFPFHHPLISVVSPQHLPQSRAETEPLLFLLIHILACLSILSN